MVLILKVRVMTHDPYAAQNSFHCSVFCCSALFSFRIQLNAKPVLRRFYAPALAQAAALTQAFVGTRVFHVAPVHLAQQVVLARFSSLMRLMNFIRCADIRNHFLAG